MSEKIDGQMTLGEVVSMFPRAVDVFNKNSIDFCCGGNRSLDDAVADKRIDASAFITDLNDRYLKSLDSGEEIRDWRQAGQVEIIDHILETHHLFMKKELPEIGDMLFLVLKVHFQSNGESLLKIHNLFGSLRTEIEEHLVKEEENLFPLIREYIEGKKPDTIAMISQIVAETENEHEKAGGIIHQIEKLTNNFSPPPEACTTYKLVYHKMNLMFKDLFNHIHLENNVLFPSIK